MAAKTAKRDPKRSDEWPVDKYPYMVERPYADPKYFPTYKQAISHLNKLLIDFREDMKLFDADVPEAVANALAQVGELSIDGGRVDVEIAPFTATRFKAELVRRQAVL